MTDPQYPYQQPPMGPQTTRMARIDPGPSYTFGFVGAAIAVVGVVLGIISFVALDWINQDGQTATFGDLKNIVEQVGGGLPGDTEIYFKWLAWVLLIVSFVIALLACLPTPANAALRGLGVLAGLAGIGLTIWAIKGSDSWSATFKDKGIGLWLALAGFLLIAIGSAIGPQRAKV